MLSVLTCPHHVQWIRRVPGGLHQCIQCLRVVSRSEVYPKLDDVPEVRRAWDEHEARRDAPPDTPAALPGKAGGEGAR